MLFLSCAKHTVLTVCTPCTRAFHDDVIKWKHFPRYWPFVRGIHRSPVNSPHKGQWRGVLVFSLICVWINGWVNNREAGDLRRYRAHYDVIVMSSWEFIYYIYQWDNKPVQVYRSLDRRRITCNFNTIGTRIKLVETHTNPVYCRILLIKNCGDLIVDHYNTTAVL